MVSAIAPPAAEALSPGRARRLQALIWGFCLLLIAFTWWFVIGQVRFEHQTLRAAGRAPLQVAVHPGGFERQQVAVMAQDQIVTRQVLGHVRLIPLRWRAPTATAVWSSPASQGVPARAEVSPGRSAASALRIFFTARNTACFAALGLSPSAPQISAIEQPS